MNRLASRRIPFLFVLDFDLQRPVVLPVAHAAAEGIYFRLADLSNYDNFQITAKPIHLEKEPVDYAHYLRGFQVVQNHLRAGNSFLVNLTYPTRVTLNWSLSEVFAYSQAPYKLLFRDNFVVFSPEPFVRIVDNTIYSFPMKGTIDADLPNAAAQVMADPKEKAEHHTIVDLIRNDLSRVSKRVRVESFRYLDRIHTNGKDLLQVSSRIVGQLPTGYERELGYLLRALLPAGSITGAPKLKTVQVIKKAEGYERGYYTGIFGYFDGRRLESAVMIRFLEKNDGQLAFKSGGGITIYSDPEREYQELIDKVYVPINRNHSD